MFKDEFVNAIADLDEEKALNLVKEKIAAGETPLQIIEQCKEGVEIVGKRYGQEEYYLSDLVMSEEIFRGVMEILEAHFPKPYWVGTEAKGDDQGQGTKVVMGTIEGDIHDLGKNITANLLRSVGFDVYDLGVDVQPEAFVRALEKTGAKILGISVLLTFSIQSVKRVVALLEEAGLRNKVTVVLGGYPVNKMIQEFTGVDYFFTDAVRAVKLFQELDH